jgi:flagellar FliL protein
VPGGERFGEGRSGMAEPGGAEDKTPAGGGKRTLLVVATLVTVLGLGGGSAYFLGLFGGDGEAQAAKRGTGHGDGHDPTAPHDASEGAIAALDSFVVNLADDGAQRYLKTTMKVEFFGGEIPALFKSREAQIRDLMLTLLSSKTVDDVRTVEGKAQLRDEVIARINRVVGGDVVKAIYFAEFIVQ